MIRYCDVFDKFGNIVDQQELKTSWPKKWSTAFLYQNNCRLIRGDKNGCNVWGCIYWFSWGPAPDGVRFTYELINYNDIFVFLELTPEEETLFRMKWSR